MVLQMIKMLKKIIHISLVFLYLSAIFHPELAHLSLINNGQDKNTLKTNGLSIELEISRAEDTCFTCLTFSSKTQVNNFSRILYRPKDNSITHLYHSHNIIQGVYLDSTLLRAPPSFLI
jgi:hypothetical protein